MSSSDHGETTPAPRFRLRVESADWRPTARTRWPSSPRAGLPGASAIWIPAARLASLRARAGETARCLLVLERREGGWTNPERAMVSASAGELRGASGVLDAAVSSGLPELAGPDLLLPWAIAVPLDAAPGRYKGPVEVRCGRRIEPLALLVEVEPA